MSLGKIVKNNGKFEFVELTEDEQYTAISEAVSKNIALLNKVKHEVIKYIESYKLLDWYTQVDQITLAIFNAIGLKSFTVLDTALSRKISDLKENGSK